ncbi:glycoside hydrolase family 3 N-terminal domain-containing protein [Cellvibrio fibrivorans]|uniref:beta-glucosidase n=1 Tax=Cellvibrio fibrivorans TaxID=126350 RepID=A0ABU1USA7_9GAMM|nr:glycoside hydrolase family 3 N-terminal domain-containing protein [Cellvibrio fibrivorans]MDR7088068.1 beta-glucosidase [Cellvibrio fibrivorans]
MQFPRFNRLNIWLAVASLVSVGTASMAAEPLYKNSDKPIEKRVNDLVKRMTLEEKVAQLQTVWVARQKLETDKGEFTAEHAVEVLGLGIGQVARPAENKAVITPNKTPAQTLAFTNAVQKYLVENTRLGIPAIFHEEALHGHAGRNATSFPQAIGLASSWDPQLIEQVYTIAAQEMRAIGAHQALAPVLDVARDPRWGRIEETLGEDPYLVAELGVAAVNGFQGRGDGIGKDRVIATLKHLAGHGEPTGGLNTAPAPIGERSLRENFLPPFEAAVKVAHARSVMASYNEIDGIPSHSNVDLLQNILRGEWGFNGVVVSDYFAIAELINRHHLAADKSEAALLALAAGVDVETPDGDAYKTIIQLVNDKKISVKKIDQAVARVLHEKFALGLFDNPYTSVTDVDAFVGNDQHVAVALQAAEKSMVLLKNDKNILPLNKAAIKSVALIGPHVDETLIGGYSDVPKKTVSILQGLQEYLGDDVVLNYEKGTLLTIEKWASDVDSAAANTRSKQRWHTDEVVLATKADTKGMIAKAVAAALKSDVAIVVVGDSEATSREAWADSHLGDRTSLELLGEQQELVDAVLATGKPTVVVLIGGRPLAITKLAETAPAILQGWYLGQETGHAVARVLFGDVNPGGKLPVSVPRSAGHLPVYYNHKPSAKRGYAFDKTDALYPFGFGLSYTQFAYADMQWSKTKLGANDTVDISVTITNTGKRAGDEVVQLYTNDPVASATQPVKQLRGFKRVSLAPQQSARVTFTLSANQLGFYDRQMDFVLEPGKINLLLGASSADIRLKGELDVVGKTIDISKNKGYLTPVTVKLM